MIPDSSTCEFCLLDCVSYDRAKATSSAVTSKFDFIWSQIVRYWVNQGTTLDCA
jgi:hypothetical protein